MELGLAAVRVRFLLCRRTSLMRASRRMLQIRPAPGVSCRTFQRFRRQSRLRCLRNQRTVAGLGRHERRRAYFGRLPMYCGTNQPMRRTAR